MARINTNIGSLIAQNNLARSQADLNTRLERLSTGLRINKGGDDPAGLIVSERLRSELSGLNQAVDNSERASLVVATTEGYLAEVADLLNSVKSLVLEASNTGGVSPDEIEANQMQIDSAIDSINRISDSASFAGLQLLNGSLEYLTSGMDDSEITGASIHNAKFGNNPSMPVNVEVVSEAKTGSLFLSGVTADATPASGELLSSITIEIAGNKGVQTLSFISGTSFSDVVDAVNTVKDSTGVSASLVDSNDEDQGLTFDTTGYGSDQFVSVRRLGEGGDFFSLHPEADDATELSRDEGEDVGAIINGVLATGKGLNASVNSSSLSVDLTLSEDFATTTGSPSTFDITGGGAMFQLGPNIESSQQVGFGMPSVAASRLGGMDIEGVRYALDSLRSGQDNALTAGGAGNAAAILDQAIDDVSKVRGRLGAFDRNTLQTNIRALQIGMENITASESQVRDADFAKETAALTRSQILTQAGTSVLATANSTSQNVLALLG